MRRGFGSDNHSGISPEIMEAIASANVEHALAYGDDEYCKHAEELFKEVFGPTARVYFVFNGTGANVLNIDAMCRSHHAVVCADTAHINVDECGAPQRIVGSRLLTVATPDGKKARVTIPAGTQDGTQLKISGKGAPKLKGTGNGDLRISVRVQVPTELNDAQKEALEAFREARKS